MHGAGAVGVARLHIHVADDGLGGDAAPLAQPGAQLHQGVPLLRGDEELLHVVALQLDAEVGVVVLGDAGGMGAAQHLALAGGACGAGAALQDEPAAADGEVLPGVRPVVLVHVVLLDGEAGGKGGLLLRGAGERRAVVVLSVVHDDAGGAAALEVGGDDFGFPFEGGVDAGRGGHDGGGAGVRRRRLRVLGGGRIGAVNGLKRITAHIQQ